MLEPLLDDPDVIVRACAIERYGHNTARPKKLTVATLHGRGTAGRTDASNDARVAAIVGI